LWKARQLKEYRRSNNLWFKRGDKYSPGHTCVAPSAAINMIENISLDGGAFLSDEVLNAMEEPQFCALQGEASLSLHALFGHPKTKAIQLRALVRNQVMVILVDSGSSHTFLNSSLALKL
jgi:hypothetical protein